MEASIKLKTERRTPKPDIRVLGVQLEVQLDSRLRWKPYLRLLEAKQVIRYKAIQMQIAST